MAPTRVGIVCGTGLYDLLAGKGVERQNHETPYGTVEVAAGELGGQDVILVERHGPGHGLPPHRIPHRANVQALVDQGVTRVIGLNSVGSLRSHVAPGSFLVPEDFVDLSLNMEERTFYHDRAVHVDFSRAYCPEVRRALLDAARAGGHPVMRAEPAPASSSGAGTVWDGGVYMTFPGPRFETRAEVRLLAGVGHVTGMTGGPEATLMRERGLCYGSVCVVANHATGVGVAAAEVSAADIVEATSGARARLVPLLEAALADAWPPRRGCACGDVLAAAEIQEG